MGDRLKNRVAIVTGAGSVGAGWGNGKATAVLFARQGAKVFCVDISLAAAEETRKTIRGEGGTAAAWQTDVSDSKAVRAMVNACIERYGRIDILHNNVGILSVGGPVEQSEEEWDRVHAVNLKGDFLTCKYVLPVMEKQGQGAIVNISSISSIRWLGVPYISYSTSKAAINQFTRIVALQYAGKGIRCNSILPGLMRTPMVEKSLAETYASGDVEEMFRIRDAQCPMGRMGDAWDVAYAALFLASDESRYITGVELIVDGGLTLGACEVSQAQPSKSGGGQWLQSSA
jgi:NAD(P)-dependent dehydrogenase (short-subunit alcohol dehydrogenase family)